MRTPELPVLRLAANPCKRVACILARSVSEGHPRLRFGLACKHCPRSSERVAKRNGCRATAFGTNCYFFRACLSTSAHQSLTFCMGLSTSTVFSLRPTRLLPRPAGDALLLTGRRPSTFFDGGAPPAGATVGRLGSNFRSARPHRLLTMKYTHSPAAT